MSFYIESTGSLQNVKADIAAAVTTKNLPKVVNDLVGEFIDQNIIGGVANGGSQADGVIVKASGHLGGGPGMCASSITLEIIPFAAAPPA